jgi:ABC-2 type transport system ATP-binding protein
MTSPVVLARGLEKSFGTTRALQGLDLDVAEGTVLSVLGPNGAGKTTAVRILSTLTRADAGHAEVMGFDVGKHPEEVRRRIGLTGQFAALDELLTGRENLEMVGRLFRVPGAMVRERAAALLDRFELTDAADRTVKGYSGGMRRRLDLAASLISSPPVLFLDEPTTGLDPRSRLGMWDLIEELRAGGTTLLLTTQYLEEADRLADDIAVIDHGKVIARGTANQLKRQVGGERLEIVIDNPRYLPEARRALEAIGEADATVNEAAKRVSVPVASHDGVLTRAIRALDEAGVQVDDIGFRRPTLDDVFLKLTGHEAEVEPAEAKEAEEAAA